MLIGYINEENFERVLTMCGNNRNYKVAILVNDITDIRVFIEKIGENNRRHPIPYLEHITYEHPWLHYYPMGKMEFSNGSSIEILHPSSLDEKRRMYHTILVYPGISDESYIEYNSRFIKGYERALTSNITQVHQLRSAFYSTSNTLFAKYALGDWGDTGYRVATISIDEENNADALDDFLKEFKIQPNIVQ